MVEVYTVLTLPKVNLFFTLASNVVFLAAFRIHVYVCTKQTCCPILLEFCKFELALKEKLFMYDFLNSFINLVNLFNDWVTKCESYHK